MGRKETAKTAFNLLSRNFDVIEKACYENNGDIFLGEDSAVPESLVRNRLAYYIEDELYIRVHSKVRALVDHVSSRFRFREKHGEFASLLETLEYALESYHRAKLKPRADICQIAFDEVREVVLDITELLDETVAMYNHFVLDDLTTAFDLDERILQTQRCKNELLQINEIFSQLSVEQLLHWAGADVLVDHLLMKLFKRNVDRSLSELNVINQKLVERLDKLNFDKHVHKLNIILDAFSKRYSDNPAYRPDILTKIIPQNLCLSEPIKIISYADFSNPIESYQESLERIGQNVKAKYQEPQIKDKHDENTAVIDVRDEKIMRIQDEVEKYLGYLFEAVLSDDYKENISAKECYAEFSKQSSAFAHKVKLKDWLFLVMSEAIARKRIVRRHARYEELAETDGVFDGTKLVFDIKFIKHE